MTDKEIRSIEFLKRLPKKVYQLSYKEVCIGIDYNVGSVPISILETNKISRFYENEPRDSTVIYRARVNTNYLPNISTLRLPFDTVDEISIIPESKKNLLKTFGRCNKPEEPRFYASNNFMTACIEALSRGIINEKSYSEGITVGMWKIIEPLVISQINFSEIYVGQLLKHSEEIYGKMLQYTKSLNDHHLQLFASQNRFSKDYAIQLLSLFADEFAKIDIQSDNDYYISNYYCDEIFNNVILKDGGQIDGILYPSVLNAYQDFNLVIHPRAMKKLEFISAMMVWATGSNEGAQFSPLEHGVKADESGKLMWKRFGYRG